MPDKEVETQKPHYDNDKATMVVYSDGSMNDEISAPGARVDLAGREHTSRFDLRHGAGNIIGVTLSDYDGTSYNYVFTESGFGPTVRFTTPKDAVRSEYEIIDELPQDFVTRLHAEPLTVKSRGNMFGEKLKVERVSTLLGVYNGREATTDKANPLVEASRILQNRADQL